MKSENMTLEQFIKEFFPEIEIQEYQKRFMDFIEKYPDKKIVIFLPRSK